MGRCRRAVSVVCIVLFYFGSVGAPRRYQVVLNAFPLLHHLPLLHVRYCMLAVTGKPRPAVSFAFQEAVRASNCQQ
jgi:hypothetical protein